MGERPNRDSGQLLAGRFELHEKLGAGGTGVVYRAYDRHLGHFVALKLLRDMDPTGLLLFKSEFRTLADVSHPNLIGLHQLLSDGEQWFFTMDLVEGTDLMSWLRPAGEHGLPNSERLRSALSQIVEGVRALHDAGLLHRDLKPSNVLVDRDGRVVICDFGTAAPLTGGQDRLLASMFHGTSSYCSPEHGTLAQSEASDWYSVGVMLYRALTGHLPIVGRTPFETLHLKQRLAPVPPREVDARVPADLDEICTGLLRLDPGARWTGQEVASALAGGHGSSRSRPFGERLIGRKEELEALEHAYREAAGGETRLVDVRGPAGIGKSMLLRSFLESLRSDHANALVVEGRCFEREQVPYKAFDAVVDALSQVLGNMSDDAVQVVIPEEITALTRVFPVLRRVPAVQRREAVELLDSVAIRRRAAGALRELLQRLGQRYTVVLHLEDVHWGDADSAFLLEELLRSSSAPLLTFLSYRTESAKGSELLSELRRREETLAGVRQTALELGPLPPEDARSMALALLDRADVDEGLLSRVARESEGNPLFIQALCRHLGTAGALDGETGDLSLEEVLRAQTAALGPDAQRALETLVVATRPLPEDIARRAADCGPRWYAARSELLSRRLVRVSRGDGESLIEPFHDRIRETAARALEPDRRAEIHGRLAEAIEHGEGRAEGSARAIELGYHFEAAGRRGRALGFALAAAEAALAQHAPATAGPQLAMAERALAEGHGQRAEWCRYYEAVADLARAQGRLDEALRSYRRARELAAGQVKRSELDYKRADVLLSQGSGREAAAALEAVLRDLGHRVPHGEAGFLAGVAHQAAVQTLHTKLPERYLGARGELGDGLAKKEVLFFSRLGHSYFVAGAQAASFWAHLNALNRVELYAPSALLGRVWTEHAVGMSVLKRHDRALDYARRGLEVRERLGDAWEISEARARMAMVLYAVARFEEAMKLIEPSVPILRAAGTNYEIFSAENHLALCHYRRGQLDRSVAIARDVYDYAVSIGDMHGPATALMVWSLSTGGDVPAGALCDYMKHTENELMSYALLARGEAARLRQLGEPRRAAEVLAEAKRRLDRSRASWAYTAAAIPAEMATSWRMEAESATSETDRQQTLLEAAAAVKVALRESVGFVNDRPRALREAGLLALLRNDTHRAAERFRQSLTLARRQGAELEAAQTRLAESRLERLLGNRDADELAGAARQELERLGAGFASRELEGGER